MTKTFVALFLLLGSSAQAQRGGAKQLIDNNRVTVQETGPATGQPAPIEARVRDIVVIDLDQKTAFFVPKGSSHPNARHAIVVDLKDVSIPPLENKTKYPLAFPRPGVKKVLENKRVIV